MRATPRFVIVLSLSAVTALAQNQSVLPTRYTAVVDGETITDEFVRNAAASEIEKIQQKKTQAYLAFKRDEEATYARTLEMIVEGKIVEREAKKRNTTPESLLKQEIDDKVPDPTEEDVRLFWQANKDAKVPEENGLIQSREILIHQRRSAVYQTYMRRLLQEYKVQKSIDPIRVPVTTEGFPAIGPAKARVTIVEFADFQCPFCAVLFHTLKDVKEQYSDNVRIVFRQFPLTNTHERAQKAAEASLCAFEQKKFWEMHDSMFLDNNNLEVPALKRKASTLMLNMNEFNSCIDSGRYASAVAADIQEGVKLGVTGTPTVFINGMSFLGAQSASDISRIIDDELMRDQKP